MDLINRQDALRTYQDVCNCLCCFECKAREEDGACKLKKWIKNLPSAEPEVKKISYTDCANAMLMMWIDEVLTDGEYIMIMDKLNTHELKERKENE